jgi:GntR family transcriptional regulator, transcriptional repressor for pyruvate dehydrogenase complex
MFERIDNESVVNNVMNKIKNSIMAGELKAGDKLPTEVELIEQLGVGRNSVREAIKMLIALGVLEVKRGQGTYVVSKVKESFFNPLLFSLIVEPKSNDDVYELRVMFDAMVLFNLTEKMTEEKFDVLTHLLDSVHQSYLEGNIDTDYYVSKDMEFHHTLMNFTENQLIKQIGEVIISLFPESMRRSISQTNGIERSIRNHRNIVELLRQKNTNEIINLVETTLTEWKEEWKNS